MSQEFYPNKDFIFFKLLKLQIQNQATQDMINFCQCKKHFNLWTKLKPNFCTDKFLNHVLGGKN